MNQEPAKPWLDEPNSVFWTDVPSMFPCAILRPPRHGALCGYVGIPPTHPFQLERTPIDHLRVHGGVTYKGSCPYLETKPEFDYPGYLWIGFDCAHGFDYIPKLDRVFPEYKVPTDLFHTKNYRTIGYVTEEIHRLLNQLAKYEVALRIGGFDADSS